MSSDKRLILTLLLTVLTVTALQSLMMRMGLIQTPPPAAANVKGKAADKKPADVADATADRPRIVNKPGEVRGELPLDPFTPDPIALDAVKPVERLAPQPSIEVAKPEELVLGAPGENPGHSPYRLQLQFDQVDASVVKAMSSRIDAELNPDARNQKPPRLTLIRDNPKAPSAPGSLSIFVSDAGKKRVAEEEIEGEESMPASKPRPVVDLWAVVRDAPGAPAIRPIKRVDPVTKTDQNGQEISFRAKLTEPPVEVTKVFRIFEEQDGFEVDLRFKGDTKDSKLTYRLVGPHGIPIEGEWFTSTFRDVFFGQVKNPTTTEVINYSAYDVVKTPNDPSQRLATLPIAFAGVENQYFATFVQPQPIPQTQEARQDQSADPIIIYSNPADTQKADVTTAINSKTIVVGPNLGETVHHYRVFAGPKSSDALAPYHAEQLASYRKYQWIKIPFATDLASYIIAPLLTRIYAVTSSIARWFGGSNGNYGVAIILLTMTVRLIMFPLSRKQAMMAKKMQDLQPILAEVKEKYKDDKEAMTRETMAVWKRYKVNPAAGCLPALIQLPIFVGLWQTLNTSVALRQSSFLFIHDLAAPDMLFRFPGDLPLVGHYFNILPFLVVALMLVQTKLFSPPPTTPEAEMQQKSMKYMMIFMAFMFYRVPSGLGIYFITSSTWQICERLLLPKIIKTPKVDPDDFGQDQSSGGKPSPQGWLGKRLEKLLEEAQKNQTIRNQPNRSSGSNGVNGSRDLGRSQNDGRPRQKPPGKRR